MKKIFLIAVVLLMMINFIINYHHEVTKEKQYTDGNGNPGDCLFSVLYE